MNHSYSFIFCAVATLFGIVNGYQRVYKKKKKKKKKKKLDDDTFL